MEVVEEQARLKSLLKAKRGNASSVGFVPTMGALHEGHLSLMQKSTAENDITVASVFVNPTQFNDPKDLKNYPRTLSKDIELLQAFKVDYLYAPSVEDVYPEPDTRIFDYPPVTSVMEGARRPGHFNGVCQVVSKLFDIVKPDKAYFGEKDFQQIAVIRAMTQDLRLPVEIVACPIVREANGLALSSRNKLLSDEEKNIACNICKVLRSSLQYAKTHGVSETESYVTEKINSVQGLEVEYYNIVDGSSLQRLDSWEDAQRIVGCVTVYCGEKHVRLIDNITYKQEQCN